MSEIDFDHLLDAVNDALDDGWDEQQPFSVEPPRPANDNRMVFPLVPFPCGWHAAC